jgi:general secretion pathway protein A
MYKAFYNLKSKPFEITTDPISLWLGENHKEALAALRYGILENKGFLLMTGAAGTGKSTLINAFTESLDDTVIWAVINDPPRERLDFYNAIAKGFGIAKKFNSKVQFLIQFSHFLHKADDEKKKVLLLIDNCHRLSQDMLEELRLLSNIEKDDAKLINIFFVGQREFNDILIQPSNRAMRQRLTIKVDLAALTAGETEEYIRHRLKVAGTEEKIFSAQAMKIIHNYSMGIQRRINIICDHALVAGSVQGNRNLDHKHVEQCIQKLNLPLKPTQEDFQGLDDEKSHLEHFRGRFTAGSAESPTTVSGINLENDERWGWLKYGVGGVALVLSAVYFWPQAGQIPEIIGNGARKVEQQVVVEEVPQVRASPAITVLEQNRHEINEEKAAEMKHAILEKAYSNGENGRQVTAEQSGVEDVVQTVRGTVDPALVKARGVKDGAVKETAPATATGDSVKAIETVVQAPEQAIVIAGPVAAAKNQGEVPVLPGKIVLPLDPNSLKLTTEANKEYKRFVEILKAYPKAKLLVKGFVSATTDSPENIKLSEERAIVVQKMLVASGIESTRMQIRGMSNREPIAPNNTNDGRTRNRRVEIIAVDNSR